MNTKRQQRLARAIEALSGKDLLAFTEFALVNFGPETKYKFQQRITQWADDTLASQKNED